MGLSDFLVFCGCVSWFFLESWAFSSCCFSVLLLLFLFFSFLSCLLYIARVLGLAFWLLMKLYTFLPEKKKKTACLQQKMMFNWLPDQTFSFWNNLNIISCWLKFLCFTLQIDMPYLKYQQATRVFFFLYYYLKLIQEHFLENVLIHTWCQVT